MGQIRVELMTPALSERCSNQLSYCPLKKSRQLPTFPLKSSIIGVRELDFRVRYGNGYCLSTMATGIYYQINQQGPLEHLLLHGFWSVAHFVCLVSSANRFQSFLMKFSYSKRRWEYGQASRPISNARLNTSLCLHLHPINQIVSLGSSEDL